jgi:hypothetical protein
LFKRAKSDVGGKIRHDSEVDWNFHSHRRVDRGRVGVGIDRRHLEPRIGQRAGEKGMSWMNETATDQIKSERSLFRQPEQWSLVLRSPWSVMYMVLTLSLSLFTGRLEKRMRQSD